jgi:putative serine protease PepD
MTRALATTAVTALVAGVAGGALALAADGSSGDGNAGTATPATRAAPAATPTAAQLYAQDDPGVVVITAQETRKTQPSLLEPTQTEQVQSLGSGFVVDRRGDIVTNDHVVAGADSLRVGFGGGASYPAKVVGADPSSDLAVIRLEKAPAALHPLAFDSSGAVHPGDPVYAIGNPFGLDSTMTAGIVSATGRDIQAPDGLTIPDAIQTDAPINHGNSGGPLIDAAGHVVGVASQIQGGTVDANVGVGFAVPSDTVRSVVSQLLAGGHVAHPWVGAGLATIDPALAAADHGLPEQGVLIVKVTAGSPAAKAGLQAATVQRSADGTAVPRGGDAVTAVDGRPVTTSGALADAVAGRKPGDRITLTVVRGGRQRQVQVTVGTAPASGLES